MLQEKNAVATRLAYSAPPCALRALGKHVPTPGPLMILKTIQLICAWYEYVTPSSGGSMSHLPFSASGIIEDILFEIPNYTTNVILELKF